VGGIEMGFSVYGYFHVCLTLLGDKCLSVEQKYDCFRNNEEVKHEDLDSKFEAILFQFGTYTHYKKDS
jgi:hypothetical protein